MEVGINNALTVALGQPLARLLLQVGAVADEAGTKAYLVGGAVRDTLLGVSLDDITPDIVVIGEVHGFAEMCIGKSQDARLHSVSRHHTASIEIGGQRIELAAARKDSYRPLGALPQISLVDNIEADLPRRDFSVNAMAVSLHRDGFGEFHDPFNGRIDCAKSTLRTLHADSFLEDTTRILRGIRLAARCKLDFDPVTATQIYDAKPVLSDFSQRSPDRLFGEFARWFKPTENLAEIMRIADRFGVDQSIGLSELRPPNERALIAVNEPGDDNGRFVSALQCYDSRGLRELDRRLPLPKTWFRPLRQIEALRELIATTDWFKLRRSQVARLLQPFDERVVAAGSIALDDDELGARLLETDKASRNLNTELSGDDVEALGIPHGTKVGEVLSDIIDLRVDGHISSRADEIRYVKSRVQPNGST